MKQNEFVELVASELGESKARAWDIVKTIGRLISKTIVEWDDVKIADFGTFSSVEVASRNGHNPQTWEKIVIPALTRAKFKPSIVLKRAFKK